MGTLPPGSPMRATIEIGALLPEPPLTSVSLLLINEFLTIFPTFTPAERNMFIESVLSHVTYSLIDKLSK